MLSRFVRLFVDRLLRGWGLKVVVVWLGVVDVGVGFCGVGLVDGVVRFSRFVFIGENVGVLGSEVCSVCVRFVVLVCVVFWVGLMFGMICRVWVLWGFCMKM